MIILSRHPNAGYRRMIGLLTARGQRVQWNSVRASMHRVDTAGIVSRMTQLGCVVRRTYSVPGPRSLVHIDTNHKLIRYNIVIFGGVDGFSRKIMYLNAANNNKAATNLSFFTEAVERFGLPQRIERLWRDVFTAVTCFFYTPLHQAEEDGLLDLSSNLILFCCHYVFIPRLQARLDEFRDGWDNHPLSTEGNRTPNQLWFLGQYHSSEDQVDEDLHIPHIDWEDSGLIPDPNCSVHVPESDYPLRPEELAGLHAAVEPLAPSTCMGVDIYMAAVQYMQSLGYI
ncbi:unnamed protein product [Arctogadus glacialis]